MGGDAGGGVGDQVIEEAAEPVLIGAAHPHQGRRVLGGDRVAPFIAHGVDLVQLADELNQVAPPVVGLDDGVVVLAAWFQLEVFDGGGGFAVERRRVDYVRAAAPAKDEETDDPERSTLWQAHTRYDVDMSDQDAVLAALVATVRAARADQAAILDARARRELAAATDAVEAAHRSPGRVGYLEAVQRRRATINTYRDQPDQRPALLTPQEIATAARITLADVDAAW